MGMFWRFACDAEGGYSSLRKALPAALHQPLNNLVDESKPAREKLILWLEYKVGEYKFYPLVLTSGRNDGGADPSSSRDCAEDDVCSEAEKLDRRVQEAVQELRSSRFQKSVNSL